MADEPQQEPTKGNTQEVFAKILYIFARFSGFFGILIALIVLLGLYRFIIQPQYEKILIKRQEIEGLNLAGEKASLEGHLVKLEQFITLSNVITDEQKNRLGTLLQDAPDLLILHIQFEKLLQRYDSDSATLELGSPNFTALQVNASDETTRDRFIDLSGFFDEEQAPITDESESEEMPTIALGVIPIDISVTVQDYFAAKDFLRDIESLVPLVDIHTVSIATAASAASDDGGELIDLPGSSGDAIVDGDESSTNAVTLTLSGIIHIARTQ